MPGPGEPHVEIAMLTARFDARPGAEESLLSALSRYVVMTRVESASAVQAHLDSPLMADMAQAAIASVAAKPEIDLYDTISAHDLK